MKRSGSKLGAVLGTVAGLGAGLASGMALASHSGKIREKFSGLTTGKNTVDEHAFSLKKNYGNPRAFKDF